MPREIAIKQGESLLLTLTFCNDDGSLPDLTSLTLAAQVRTPIGDLVATLPIAKTIVLNVATVEVDNTSLWPLGMLRSDVSVTIGARVALSETFGIRVNKAVTQ